MAFRSPPPSTFHACRPDFSGVAGRMGHGDLAPNYNICVTMDHLAGLHCVPFLDAQKVKALKD
jgi:hypothetical protein